MRSLFLAFLALIATTHSVVVAQRADSDGLEKIKSITGVVLQEKDGQVIGVDFRMCGEAWTEALPAVMAMPSVQTLSVTGPLATHERIVALAAMPNLKTLRLEQSAVTDATMAEISKFSKIEDLNLDRCDITDDAFKSFAQCKTLKRIRVPKTKISDAGLAHIEDMVQLELLDLSDCNQVTNEGVKHLQKLTKLRNLGLWGPRITDECMPYLSGLTNMVAISFQDTAVTDAGFPAISGMTKLKEFDIFRTQVGDGALAIVANAKDMAKMKLRDSGVSTKGIAEHITKFENLTVLDLSETRIKNPALVSIGKLKKLEDLNLWHTRVTDEGMGALVDLKLKKLNLDDIAGIGDGAIPHVAKIKTLEFLHLGKTGVTDEGLKGLESLTNLKDLILTNTAVSKKAVRELQAKLPKLKIKE